MRQAALSALLVASLAGGVLAAFHAARPSRLPAARDNAAEAMGALRWRLDLDRDEHGRVLPGALWRALQQRQRLVREGGGRPGAKAAGLGGWTFRGPSNVGGRTRALWIDPRNPSHLWAGSVGGGIFSTGNGGKTWAPLNDFFPNLSVSCLVQDPADPATIFVGTGEGLGNADSIRGAGIFVTHDGGGSFEQLPGTGEWAAVNRLAIAPDSSTLLAATDRGIFRSGDGGASWSQVTTGRALQVAFNPHDAGAALASEGGGFRQKHRILSSSDGGATWSPASVLADSSEFTSRIELAFAPSDPAVVYAMQDGLLWRSNDGGGGWDPVGAFPDDADQWWYDSALWVSPTDPNFLLVGGVFIARSVDGGHTLTRISSGYLLTQQVHPDVHTVVADPRFDGRTNRRVYVGCDGGVFVADNVATVNQKTGWRSLNTGYASAQYYHGTGDGPTGLLLGGLQDNGTLRLQKKTTATLTFGGDGGDVEIDPQLPGYVYFEYQFLGGPYRSKDGGNHVEANLGVSLPESGSGDFIAPFRLDPTDGNRMLAGAGHLWRTTNVRTGKPPAWEAIKDEVFRGDEVQKIRAIAISPADPDRVWVGHRDGQLYVSHDARSPAPGWDAVDDNGDRNPLPNRAVTRILALAEGPGSVLVSFGGFRADNLWRSDDGGFSWRSLGGGLPAAPILALAQHPRHPDWLYVGTEVGVFASEDGGATWSADNEGPGSVAVDDLRFLNRSTTLLAATHGRGLWTQTIP